MHSATLPYARRDNLIVEKVDDEVLLYDLQNEKAHVLNPTAALVWKLADGNRTIADLAHAVALETQSPSDEDLVWLALSQLSRAGLLQASATPTPTIPRMNRREFLQKATYAAVLIPVVKTIQAPGPSTPVSCLGLGAKCDTDGQCCSDFCFSGICIPGDCFIAGTPVLYADGTRCPIDQ